MLIAVIKGRMHQQPCAVVVIYGVDPNISALLLKNEINRLLTELSNRNSTLSTQ